MNAFEAITNWWLTNARIKHGHPPAEPATAGQQPTQPMSTWKKIALATIPAAMLGGGIGAPLAAWWFGDSEQPAVVEQPQEQYGSLYQYLEDNGFHVE